MQGEYQASERLYAPRMSEDHLSIGDVHSELVAEALLHIIRHLFQLLVSLGNSGIRDLEGG